MFMCLSIYSATYRRQIPDKSVNAHKNAVNLDISKLKYQTRHFARQSFKELD